MKWMILFLAACAGSQPPPPEEGAADCMGALEHALLSSETCNEAQMRADGILVLYPACRGIFGDANFDICGKVRKDGGHGDH